MFLFALVYTAGTVSGMYGREFGFLVFAMLVVALIAECVVSKGSFSGVRRIVCFAYPDIVSCFCHSTIQIHFGRRKP